MLLRASALYAPAPSACCAAGTCSSAAAGAGAAEALAAGPASAPGASGRTVSQMRSRAANASLCVRVQLG